MISPALILSWMWGKKRKPMPEYQSPNTWSGWQKANNEALFLLDRLTKTFNKNQIKLYVKYREFVLKAEREKPWQNQSGSL